MPLVMALLPREGCWDVLLGGTRAAAAGPPCHVQMARCWGSPPAHTAGGQLRSGRAAALRALAQARPELQWLGWDRPYPKQPRAAAGQRSGSRSGFPLPASPAHSLTARSRALQAASTRQSPKQPLALPLASGRSLPRVSSIPLALPLSPCAVPALRQRSMVTGTWQPPHRSPAQAGLRCRPGMQTAWTNSHSLLCFSLAKRPSERRGHAQGAPAFTDLTALQTGMGICACTKASNTSVWKEIPRQWGNVSSYFFGSRSSCPPAPCHLLAAHAADQPPSGCRSPAGSAARNGLRPAAKGPTQPPAGWGQAA